MVFMKRKLICICLKVLKMSICKLQKALHGVKQAPLKWNKCITDFFKSKGFEQLKSELVFLKQMTIIYL